MNPRRGLAFFLRRIVFSYERFDAHELANHAAAGAYAFLLSATPAVLIMLAIATALLRRAPKLLMGLVASLKDFFGPLGAERIALDFFSRPIGGIAAFLGAASLVWAARLFVVTIQRGIRVIWADTARGAPVRENLLAFAVELLCLVAAVTLLVGTQAARLVLERASGLVGNQLAAIFRALLLPVPTAALFAFVYLTFRYIPPERPSRKASVAAAALCVLLFGAFSEGLRYFIDTARYELLYGVLGGLIILLAKVYAFFSLYFYCAEFAYVEQHFDALLFARYRRLAKAEKPGKLELRLFGEPPRLLERYGRSLRAGERIFEAGDESRQAYFVHRGSVGIYLTPGSEERIARLGTGELFGEMAELLGEPRTASARAEDDSLVLELPPAIFGGYLRTDAEASRRLVDTLSTRLKNSNRMIAEWSTAEGEKPGNRPGSEKPPLREVDAAPRRMPSAHKGKRAPRKKKND